MAQPITPNEATNSYLVSLGSDTVLWKREQLFATLVTTSVLNTAINASSAPSTIYTVSYSIANTSLSTYGSGMNAYTVSIERFSTPIQSLNVTHYFTVVASNTTVFNSYGSPSSLLLGAASDVVSYQVSVVADSIG
jgi:hypothetical protein